MSQYALTIAEFTERATRPRADSMISATRLNSSSSRWLASCVGGVSSGNEMDNETGPAAASVLGGSPREELPGGVGSSDAPPGEDASETTVLVAAGVHCRALTRSRNAKSTVIARVGCSTISIPWL